MIAIEPTRDVVSAVYERLAKNLETVRSVQDATNAGQDIAQPSGRTHINRHGSRQTYRPVASCV